MGELYILRYINQFHSVGIGTQFLFTSLSENKLTITTVTLFTSSSCQRKLLFLFFHFRPISSFTGAVRSVNNLLKGTLTIWQSVRKRRASRARLVVGSLGSQIHNLLWPVDSGNDGAGGSARSGWWRGGGGACAAAAWRIYSKGERHILKRLPQDDRLVMPVRRSGWMTTADHELTVKSHKWYERLTGRQWKLIWRAFK